MNSRLSYTNRIKRTEMAQPVTHWLATGYDWDGNLNENIIRITFPTQQDYQDTLHNIEKIYRSVKSWSYRQPRYQD